MRLACLLVFLVCAAAQQQKLAEPPPPGPDKMALRQQISDLKIKSFEIQQQVELLEKQIKDIEEADANKLAASQAISKTAPARARCGGHTKDGKRCTRMADSGSRFCWQHKVGR